MAAATDSPGRRKGPGRSDRAAPDPHRCRSSPPSRTTLPCRSSPRTGIVGFLLAGLGLLGRAAAAAAGRCGGRGEGARRRRPRSRSGSGAHAVHALVEVHWDSPPSSAPASSRSGSSPASARVAPPSPAAAPVPPSQPPSPSVGSTRCTAPVASSRLVDWGSQTRSTAARATATAPTPGRHAGWNPLSTDPLYALGDGGVRRGQHGRGARRVPPAPSTSSPRT